MGFIMKFKTIMAITLVLLTILTISAVSASGDVDALATDNTEEAVVDASLDEGISENKANQVLTSNDVGNLSSNEQDEIQEEFSDNDLEILADGNENGMLCDDGTDSEGSGIELWVSDGFFSIECPFDSIPTKISVPKDVGGKVTFSFEEDVFYEKDLSDFDKSHIKEGYYCIYLEEFIGYIVDNLHRGDFIKFAFLDENGDEIESKELRIFMDGDLLAFEDNPFFDIEVIIPNEAETYEIGDNVGIGQIFVPDIREFYGVEVVLTITRNGEVMSIFKTSDIEPEYDEETQANKYTYALDLTKLSDKDVLEFILDDKTWFASVEINGSGVIFHDDYREVIEWNVFFGNLTNGGPNGEMMGWKPNGTFAEICIPDKFDIADGNLIVSDGGTILFTKSLSEFEKEYDYGHLGYKYTLNLTEIDVDAIPEDKTITVTFNSTKYSASKARIRNGELVYVINTPDDIKRLIDFKLVNNELTNDFDAVLNFVNVDANYNNLEIEIGAGYFTIYLNGTKVDLEDKLSSDEFYTFLFCGPDSPKSLDFTLFDLGIKQSGVYNIRVTHTPSEPDDEVESYLCMTETELINENIVVNRKPSTLIVVDSTFSRYANDYNAGERGAFFYGTLYDVDGNKLVNKTVQITVNGVAYAVRTDKNGKAGLQVNLGSANTYTYALFFQGDENYTASLLASSKLKVVKKTTKIIANNMEFKTQAKTKTVTVALNTIKNPYDKKFYLSKGKTLTLSVNGKTYSAKADAKGVTKFNIQITKKGTYTATIKFAGDKTYEAVTKTIKIVISDSPKANKALSGVGVGFNAENIDTGSNPNIEDFAQYFYERGIPTSNVDSNKKNVTLEVDKNFTRVANDYWMNERGDFFYATLKDSDGNPLVNKKVQIAINGPIYYVTTDSEGRAGLQVNLASANTYTYALAFSGDAEYNAAPLASSKLIVTKKPMTIVASDKSFSVADGMKIVEVTFKTSKNPYDGNTYLGLKSATLTVNGKTYSASFSKDMRAMFDIGDLTKKGTYNALIKFGGDQTYNSASMTIKITIK